MHRTYVLAAFALAGCSSLQPVPEQAPTRQVAADPFTEPRKPSAITKVNCAPASQDASARVDIVSRQLIGKNPQIGLRPNVIALGSPDLEIFHVGLNTVYVTEGLIKQCGTDANLAAVLAYEFGRMVSKREATVSDDIRQPERLPPAPLPIGSHGYADDADPTYQMQIARFEKNNPRHLRKLPPPDPQQVARSILEHADFQRTELDAVLPLLQQADQRSILQNQFNGTLKQGDWRQP